MNNISIIIPHLSQTKALSRTVTRLREQDNEIEIIIIDNGSPPDELVHINKLNAKVVTYTESKSPYCCRNYGAKLASGDILLFLDAKSTPCPDFLNNVKYWATKDNWDILSGKINITNLGPHSSYLSIFYALYHLKSDPIFFDGVTSTLTTLMLIKKTAFDSLGGFKTSRSGNDTEIGRQARQYGLAIKYAPEIQINYNVKSRKEVLSFIKRIANNETYFFRFLDMRPPNPSNINFRLKYINYTTTPLKFLKLYFTIWYIRIYTYLHKYIIN